MLRFINLILLFIAFNTAGAFCAIQQKTDKKPLVVKYDSVEVVKKTFNKQALKEYTKLDEFKYNEAYEGLSLWQRFWIWFWSLFGNKGATAIGLAITYTLLALGIAGLVFLIMKLAGVSPLGLIRGEAANATLAYSEHVENIHQLDVDEEIAKAVSAGNYRLAVRMLYLKTLKQLNAAGLIHWDINKTNSQYSLELNNAEQRLHFNLLTKQFEYIWYGEFNIDVQVFEQVKRMFNDFKVKTS